MNNPEQIKEIIISLTKQAKNVMKEFKTVNELKERLCEYGFPEAVVFDNYLDAVIGIDAQGGRVIYDYDLMVHSLIINESMSEEDAIEWIEYNTIRSLPYTGENGPIIMNHFIYDDDYDGDNV